MARRMFSDEITNTDAFLDMPAGSQLLYFHLGMQADDDGFISSPRMVMRSIGASSDELKILFAKKFLLTFDNGVCVVKHWRINNQIRKDRYRETKYIKEKSTLFIRENGAYTFNQNDAVPVPKGHFLPLGNLLATDGQPSIGKDRLGKDSIDTIIKAENKKNFDEFWLMYPRKVEKKKAKQKWDRLNVDVQEKILDDIPFRLEDDGWKRGYIPHPTTYLNGERWNDEIKKSGPASKAPEVKSFKV